MNVIYAISCEDRYYIGSTKNFFKRKAEHTGLLERGKHSNQYMQRVYDKYGGLHFKILENVDVKDDLLEREQVHIDRHYSDPKCMNLSPHAHRGYNPWTAESRAKLSKTCTGRVHGPEAKLKQSLAKKGKRLTNEHRSNITKVRHKNAKIYTNDVVFIWNDATYSISTLSEFLELFDTSSRCIFRRLAANKNTTITLARVREGSKHPFNNGDKLSFLCVDTSHRA
tara:strand:+ start:961 stop:1635 length:675 start_codon:yes stop_codon:yes gene_type:complete